MLALMIGKYRIRTMPGTLTTLPRKQRIVADDIESQYVLMQATSVSCYSRVRFQSFQRVFTTHNQIQVNQIAHLNPVIATTEGIRRLVCKSSIFHQFVCTSDCL